MSISIAEWYMPYQCPFEPLFVCSLFLFVRQRNKWVLFVDRKSDVTKRLQRQLGLTYLLGRWDRSGEPIAEGGPYHLGLRSRRR